MRLWILLAMVPTLAWAQGSFGQAEPGDEQPAEVGVRRAFLIGINDYTGDFAPLRFAEADATGLGAVLSDPDLGGFASVEVVTEGDLSSSALVERLQAWAGTLGSEDFAFVYFSGHGVRWIDERNRSRVFLATPSTDKANPLGNAIPLTALQEFLETLPARRRALVIDACLTGDGKVSGDAATAAAAALVDEKMPFTERPSSKEALLFATTYGRPALEREELGHGVFTSFLIDALGTRREEADINGDRVVSISEAYDWARDGTMQSTADVQIPMVIYKIIGREELVVSGAPSDRTAAEMAVVSAYQGPQQGIVMFVDGEEKGAFPRSVSIEPGSRVVEFRNEAGKVIDRGRFRFKKGIAYDAGQIRNQFNGGQFTVTPGYAHYVFPSASHVSDKTPHGPGARVGLGLRFGGKSPAARVAGLDLDFGFGQLLEFPPDDGSVVNYAMPQSTIVEAGFGPSFRLKLGPPVTLSIQPRGGILLLTRNHLAPEEVDLPTDERIFINWFMGNVGVRLAATIRPHPAVGIHIGYTPMGTLSTMEGLQTTSSGQPAPGVNLLHRVSLSAQIGF